VAWSPFLGRRLGVKEYGRAHKGMFALSNNVACWFASWLLSLVIYTISSLSDSLMR